MMKNRMPFFLMLFAFGVSSFGQEIPIKPHADHAVYFDVSPLKGYDCTNVWNG